jgi:hypothetical protein
VSIETLMRDGSTADNDLPVSIQHCRDVIAIEGKLEQDYNFLMYRFKSGVVARTYLDCPQEVALLEPLYPAEIEGDVLDYLKSRFSAIRQLGGAEGYTAIWGYDD